MSMSRPSFMRGVFEHYFVKLTRRSLRYNSSFDISASAPVVMVT